MSETTITKGTLSVYKKTKDPSTMSMKELEAVLNPKQKLFCANYLKYNNGAEAAKQAGYSEKSSTITARNLLSKNKFVVEYIYRKQQELQTATIADAQEILQYLTDVMRGEINDQFGLEASLAERTKAAQELAKRQIDMALKLKEYENTAKIEISLKRNSRPDDVIDVN